MNVVVGKVPLPTIVVVMRDILPSRVMLLRVEWMGGRVRIRISVKLDLTVRAAADPPSQPLRPAAPSGGELAMRICSGDPGRGLQIGYTCHTRAALAFPRMPWSGLGRGTLRATALALRIRLLAHSELLPVHGSPCLGVVPSRDGEASPAPLHLALPPLIMLETTDRPLRNGRMRARWKLEGAVRRLGAWTMNCMRSDLPPLEDRLAAAELRGKEACLGACSPRDLSQKRPAGALQWNVLARRLGKRRNGAAWPSTLRASRKRRRRGRAMTPQPPAAAHGYQLRNAWRHSGGESCGGHRTLRRARRQPAIATATRAREQTAESILRVRLPQLAIRPPRKPVAAKR